ncbi:TadE family protein [Microbacterium thalli]|uniref:TadE family protein n=1 Tax=Microbacterium thalli TaxID=3027921 RepID=UPI00236727A1|nr:TadE family protein [Microbacterium thalli]MDD7929876.1 TadE family protein [Microbacterium thalli]
MPRQTTRSDARPARTLGPADEGSASLEFLVAGLILLVPITYLAVVLGVVHTHALATQATARHVARAIAVASGPDAADGSAARIAQAIADEYGVEPGTIDLRVSCPGAGVCPQAGGLVTVTARTEVPLPLLPPVLGLDRWARVPVDAVAVQRMSRLWGTR